MSSCMANRPRLNISHGPKKKIIQQPDPPSSGTLTPDVQTDTLPSFTRSDAKKDDVLKLGKYLLFRQNEKLDAYQAIDTSTQEELTCKCPLAEQGLVQSLRCLVSDWDAISIIRRIMCVPWRRSSDLTMQGAPSAGRSQLQSTATALSSVALHMWAPLNPWQHEIDASYNPTELPKAFPLDNYRESLSPYWQVDSHEHVATSTEIVLGQTKAYIFFPKSYGDLHSYVRQKKRLQEDEARKLFQQIVLATSHCHDSGVILRDLKLRKFVFEDVERTKLQLEGLEDAVVLSEDDQDVLKDKHGCPAYVSPEILSASEAGYSGKSADVWSLGVMLYTMLVGRYPFHDAQPLALFGKIRRGQFHIPDCLSPKARCLIRCLLRRDPAERPSVGDILAHPWFRSVSYLRRLPNNQHSKLQVVPDCPPPHSREGPMDW